MTDIYMKLSPSELTKMECVPLISPPIINTSTHAMGECGWSCTLRQSYGPTYRRTARVTFTSPDGRNHLTVKFWRTERRIVDTWDLAWEAMKKRAYIGKVPRLNSICTAEVVKSMADEEFKNTVEAVNAAKLELVALRGERRELQQKDAQQYLGIRDERDGLQLELSVARAELKEAQGELSALENKVADYIVRNYELTSELQKRAATESELETLQRFNAERLSRLEPDALSKVATVEKLRVVEFPKRSSSLLEEAVAAELVA